MCRARKAVLTTTPPLRSAADSLAAIVRAASCGATMVYPTRGAAERLAAVARLALSMALWALGFAETSTTQPGTTLDAHPSADTFMESSVASAGAPGSGAGTKRRREAAPLLCSKRRKASGPQPQAAPMSAWLVALCATCGARA